MIRYLIISFLLIPITILSQVDCQGLEIIGVYDEQNVEHRKSVSLILTGGTLGGYTDMLFLNDQGDTITIPTGPHYYLPLSDTLSYLLKLKDGLRDFPENFKGYLKTLNPDCIVPYNLTTSTDRPDSESFLKISPNPFVSDITLEGKRIEELQITDISGEILVNMTDLNPPTTINLTELTAGKYIVNFKFYSGKTTSRKIIKVN